MEETPLIRLNLCAPLVYARTDNLPPDLAENGEFLLCFDLDPVQSRSIEPDPGLLLDSLVFTGKTGGLDTLQAQTVSLPAGMYLFTQRRSALNRQEWLDLAIEQQKDGLWERYKTENRLYVRHLFEDGSHVTQLFRPLSGI